jgi:flagellum-specific ATP synthase
MSRSIIDLAPMLSGLRASPPQVHGTLVRLVGLRLEARGIQAPMGALCEIIGDRGLTTEAEVVGFNDRTLYLMPFSEPQGISPGASVRVVSGNPQVPLGDALLGRVIDGRGRPLDGKPPPAYDRFGSLQGTPPNPIDRPPIREILDVGIKAINGVLTFGRGQRLGLIAGSGVGKSVLLGMLTRFTEADVIVTGLIGERGREVRSFIEEAVGEAGLARSVIVAAPANVSPVLRLRATLLTHAIAEHFRDQGRNVLMLVDSLTRVAHAQREIGLAIGEPPTAKGYPPSVFGLLPTLIERAGVGAHGRGCISAIYTVLAEGDDASDPIVDIARASLDGQVMLSRRLADAAHYPAIDLNGSISRIMPDLLPAEDLRRANRLRRLWSLYQQNAELINAGAYEVGANAELDLAIRLREGIEAFLRQDMHQPSRMQDCQHALRKLLGD